MERVTWEALFKEHIVAQLTQPSPNGTPAAWNVQNAAAAAQNELDNSIPDYTESPTVSADEALSYWDDDLDEQGSAA